MGHCQHVKEGQQHRLHAAAWGRHLDKVGLITTKATPDRLWSVKGWRLDTVPQMRVSSRLLLPNNAEAKIYFALIGPAGGQALKQDDRPAALALLLLLRSSNEFHCQISPNCSKERRAWLDPG